MLLSQHVGGCDLAAMEALGCGAYMEVGHQLSDCGHQVNPAPDPGHTLCFLAAAVCTASASCLLYHIELSQLRWKGTSDAIS